MNNEIKKRFEDASQYDNMMGRVFPGYGQLPLVVLSYLRTRIGSIAHLLDVGCGTGTILEAFAKNQPDWLFIGVDPAEPMIDIARSKMVAIGAEHRVTLHNGTVNTLPVESRFDAATCILVEHLLPDDGSKLQLLRDINQRLVSGGWFILLGLNGDLHTESAQCELLAWLEFVAIQGLPQDIINNVRHRATVEDSLIPEARIHELLREAGFINITKTYQVQLLGGWIAQKGS